MKLGVIADDFTGASDIGAMLARGGMATQLIIGIPENHPAPSDAAVVALKSRSIGASDAVDQSLRALEWLQHAGCTQFVFKYCSTFDSTPRGNIGPVAEALARRLEANGVVVCPALPDNGRTVYQGHLFVADRLLSESGLERHPLNPMTDPDIRRWLALQTSVPVGHIPHAIVRRGSDAIRQALREASETLVVVDATSNDDVVAIGFASADAQLITGGSGVAMGLPHIYRQKGLLESSEATFQATEGFGLVLSGSCSPMTRQQVAAFADHPREKVSIERLMAGQNEIGRLIEFAKERAAENPLIFSSDEPAEVALLQERYGSTLLAQRLEELFADLARKLVPHNFNRLVVAGGETSGAVVSALDIRQFSIGPEIAPGVPALSTNAHGGLAMVLKSGNFGGPLFFETALEMLAVQNER